MKDIALIRERERQSHIQAYTENTLYKDGSWLKKPVRTVMDLLPCFGGYTTLRVLDLGCGVGRNSIAIARHFRDSDCRIDCVDLLDVAIERLNEYARQYGVSSAIRGYTASIEDFSIAESTYDLILAVSALEHMESAESFFSKIQEIKNGTKNGGIVCLILNSNITEHSKSTGEPVPPQFEVNLPTAQLQALLSTAFAGWEVLKSTVRRQRYDIPRGDWISDLQSDVVTFAAKRKGGD